MDDNKQNPPRRDKASAAQGTGAINKSDGAGSVHPSDAKQQGKARSQSKSSSSSQIKTDPNTGKPVRIIDVLANMSNTKKTGGDRAFSSGEKASSHARSYSGSLIQFVAETRDSRKYKHLALWLLIILIPMLIAVFYYITFAKNRYVSVAQVAVRQAGSNETSQVPGLAAMLGSANPTSREETLYLRELITSQDMLNVLQEKLNWSEHYAGYWRDPLFWLSGSAPDEDILKYYRRLVSAHFDDQTGLLKIHVQAFNADFAQQVLKVILADSERFVNELSHRMAREQMQFAQAELSNARRVYEERRQAMTDFQSSSNLLDAEAAAQARATIIADLEAQLTRERAMLKALSSTLDSNTPQVRQQRNKIQALEQQLAAESRRLVSAQGEDKLNIVAAKYRNLTIDAGIAEEAYKYSVTAVETARIEASKKIRSLVTVVSPNLPDDALYPERIYNLVTLFAGLLLLYGIARFVIASIDDHRD